MEKSQMLLTLYIKLRIKCPVSNLGFFLGGMAERFLCKLKLKPYGTVQLKNWISLQMHDYRRTFSKQVKDALSSCP